MRLGAGCEAGGPWDVEGIPVTRAATAEEEGERVLQRPHYTVRAAGPTWANEGGPCLRYDGVIYGAIDICTLSSQSESA